MQNNMLVPKSICRKVQGVYFAYYALPHFADATGMWLGHRDDHGIGGQTRADFFKSAHESAKSALLKLLQTLFHQMHTFCRLFAYFVDG